MWELNYEESWVWKNWCFWTVVLEKALKSPLDSKEMKPVHPKGNKSWKVIGRTDTEAETPILRPHDAKSWLIGKDPDVRKDWRQEETGTTENETVGWHHQLNGQEFEQGLGDGDGQGSLACCSPLDCKDSDMTERLNNKCHFTEPWGQSPVTLILFLDGKTKAPACVTYSKHSVSSVEVGPRTGAPGISWVTEKPRWLSTKEGLCLLYLWGP